MATHYLNLSRWLDLDLAPADRAVLHSMVDETERRQDGDPTGAGVVGGLVKANTDPTPKNVGVRSDSTSIP